jgi:hypothetical protein
MTANTVIALFETGTTRSAGSTSRSRRESGINVNLVMSGRDADQASLPTVRPMLGCGQATQGAG